MKKIPRATYRLQFHKGFTFDDAAAVADYLSALGVSHIYASPYLRAAPGSTHGYDVTDHSRVNEDLGGGAAHCRMCRILRENGLGQIIDVVPNHMSVSPPVCNRWWWDVLKNGPQSPFEPFFDIDWDPPEKRLKGKVLLPVLGDHYGRELEQGKIRAAVRYAEMIVEYREMIFPVSPTSHAGQDLYELAERLCADRKAMDNFLQKQHYRLTFWRSASRDLNYRRFFSINDLAAIRIEGNAVFTETHRLIFQWLHKKTIDGLRIDHPDGFADPDQYFHRLSAAAPDAWIVVEKILHPGENLPAEWPVAGTTGYDFLNLTAGLFIDPAGEIPLTRFYDAFTGETIAYDDLVYQCKHQVMDDLLGADVNRLAEIMVRICERHPCHRDYTRYELKRAIKELLCCMPVYRAYVRRGFALRTTDARTIEDTVSMAKIRCPRIDPSLFDFIGDLLCGRIIGELEEEFMVRFQQLSGPVTAKGLEDTAFYRYNRLSGQNEVGADPSVFGVSPAVFHENMRMRVSRYPAAMLATSTHDTKRSEDVRARMALLSEMPAKWEKAVSDWSAANAVYRRNGLPDANMEYLLYQTLVGAWPLSSDRAAAFMEKAAREAKRHTSWENPDSAYEAALQAFVTGVLSDDAFLSALSAFVVPLVYPGRINAMAQVLIKLTAPGVPDIYQGTELWDMSLVDPDNRRPVDFPLRRKRLRSLENMTPELIMAAMDKGLPKLYLICQALWLRKKHPEMFAPSAGYAPLDIRGKQQTHAIAYLRGEQVAVIVPRLVMGFSGDWVDTKVELPRGRWQNRFTGETVEADAGGRCPGVSLGRMLKRFPIAMLVKET